MTAKDAVQEDYSDIVLSAVHQDLEFRSVLPVARHYVENLLAAFAHAVSANDPASLGALMHTVHIRFVPDDQQPHELTAEEIIDWFAPQGRTTLVTTNNLSLRHSGSSVHYAAMYQVWDTHPVLECSAIGTFHGRLDAGPQVWRWTVHTVGQTTGTVWKSLQSRERFELHPGSAIARQPSHT